MLAFPIATAAILLIGESSTALASTASSKHPKVLKTEFMRAMTKHQNKSRQRKLRQKDFQAELYGTSKKSAALRKKLIEKSTVVKSPGGQRKLQNQNYNYNGNGDDDAWKQDAQANYEYQANYNNNGEKNYKYNANKDGSDDYFMAYGEWENEFGFDVTQFSLSYNRCASVRQYDDEIAAQEDTASVFATKRFAVFRFCPAQTCMGFQEDGDDVECDEDTYGEDYCDYMEEYGEWYKESGGAERQYNEDGQDENGMYWDGKYRNAEYINGKWVTPDGGYCDENGFDDAGECNDPAYFGARGEGCQNNYGEYMMEVDEYLQLMLEWQEERVQTYLTYCEECMFNVYQVWLQNGGQNRKLTYDEFKNSKEHDELRKLADQNEHRKLGNYYGACPEYDTCAEYQNFGGMDDSYSEYFECTEIERNNGQVAYIGLHCAEDGYTITLGVFSDEYCNEYIGNGVNIANFLGEDFDWEEDALKGFYNSAHGEALDQLEFINEENVCIPCSKGGLMWEEAGYVEDEDDDNYDADVEINELCQNMYEVSARCDKHYRSYNSRSKQAKYTQAIAQEDLTCDFIDSVVMGNYDEMGIVNLGDNYKMEDSNSGVFKDNMYAEQYGHYISEVTPLQIFGLILSILAVSILAVWSMTLHKSLTKTGPWRPRRGMNRAPDTTNDDPISRQNSGIVMGRSQSNTSYYMS